MHVGGDLIALSFKAPSFLSFRFLLVFPPIALSSPQKKTGTKGVLVSPRAWPGGGNTWPSRYPNFRQLSVRKGPLSSRGTSGAAKVSF